MRSARAAQVLAEFRQPTAVFTVEVAWARISTDEADLLAVVVPVGSLSVGGLGVIRKVLDGTPEESRCHVPAQLTSGFDLTHEVGETKAFLEQDFEVESARRLRLPTPRSRWSRAVRC